MVIYKKHIYLGTHCPCGWFHSLSGVWQDCLGPRRISLKRPSSLTAFRSRSTHSSIAISEGISDHNRAYFTGVTCSWGSRSTCMCSISRQKEALRSYGRFSSDMHRRMRSTSSWPDISFIAKYCRSRHILAKRFSWYLRWHEWQERKHQYAYTQLNILSYQ